MVYDGDSAGSPPLQREGSQPDGPFVSNGCLKGLGLVERSCLGTRSCGGWRGMLPASGLMAGLRDRDSCPLPPLPRSPGLADGKEAPSHHAGGSRPQTPCGFRAGQVRGWRQRPPGSSSRVRRPTPEAPASRRRPVLSGTGLSQAGGGCESEAWATVKAGFGGARRWLPSDNTTPPFSCGHAPLGGGAPGGIVRGDFVFLEGSRGAAQAALKLLGSGHSPASVELGRCAPDQLAWASELVEGTFLGDFANPKPWGTSGLRPLASWPGSGSFGSRGGTRVPPRSQAHLPREPASSPAEPGLGQIALVTEGASAGPGRPGLSVPRLSLLCGLDKVPSSASFPVYKMTMVAAAIS